MPNLTTPSKSSVLKLVLALVTMAFIGAAGTFSYLGFLELQQLNDSITEDRERLAVLENAPTPNRHTRSHVDRFVPANQALRSQSGNN